MARGKRFDEAFANFFAHFFTPHIPAAVKGLNDVFFAAELILLWLYDSVVLMWRTGDVQNPMDIRDVHGVRTDKVPGSRIEYDPFPGGFRIVPGSVFFAQSRGVKTSKRRSTIGPQIY